MEAVFPALMTVLVAVPFGFVGFVLIDEKPTIPVGISLTMLGGALAYFMASRISYSVLPAVPWVVTGLATAGVAVVVGALLNFVHRYAGART